MFCRTVNGVKKKIDSMAKRGEIILDHGIGNYSFLEYEYIEHWFESNELKIYALDFNGKKFLYATLTDDNLRKPKGDIDFCEDFWHCSWDKRWPNLLELKEYTYK